MNTIVDALVWWVEDVPDHPAIDFEGDVLTYAELDQWASAVAGALVRDGVRQGDRVAIVGGNTLEWCVAAVGAWKLGAIVAPFNHRFQAGELAALVELCEPTVVLADDSHIERLGKAKAAAFGGPPFGLQSLQELVTPLRGAAAEPVVTPYAEPDDATAIVFTSGTTGMPKGVTFTHRTVAGIMHEWAFSEPVEPHGLRILMVIPMFTAGGIIWGLGRALVDGGTMYLQSRFDPSIALRVLQESRISTLTGPPILFEQIAGVEGFADLHFEHLTTAGVGGARVSVSLLQSWLAQGVALRQLYGQTEIGGTGTITSRAEAAEHPDTCGRGGVFTRLRILGEHGRDCPAGTVGEIVMRGPGMTPGYWRDESATAATIRNGWLHTGDLGFVDDDGRLAFVDRIGEMINTGGLKVSPAEIESVIAQVLNVAEVAVIPVPDAKFGQTPAAVISPSGDVDVVALIAFCNEQLADYKVPRYVIHYDGPLPRMASGKIAKRDLRSEFADAPDRFPKVR